MKHTPPFSVFILILLTVFLLTGCSSAPAAPTDAPAPTETMPAVTELPTVPATQPPTEAPTLPPHSDLYVPGLPVEDVILYFNEVCLDAEYINSGNPSVLQKWIAPISYQIHGIPTEDDLETLAHFTQWLNTIEGFPGIAETEETASPSGRQCPRPFSGTLPVCFPASPC